MKSDSVVDLKEFIKATLWDIGNAISEINENKGMKEFKFDFNSDETGYSPINFEVRVLATDIKNNNQEVNAKGSIEAGVRVLASFTGGAEGKLSKNKENIYENTSKITFSIIPQKIEKSK